MDPEKTRVTPAKESSKELTTVDPEEDASSEEQCLGETSQASNCPSTTVYQKVCSVSSFSSIQSSCNTFLAILINTYMMLQYIDVQDC